MTGSKSYHQSQTVRLLPLQRRPPPSPPLQMGPLQGPSLQSLSSDCQCHPGEDNALMHQSHVWNWWGNAPTLSYRPIQLPPNTGDIEPSKEKSMVLQGLGTPISPPYPSP